MDFVEDFYNNNKGKHISVVYKTRNHVIYQGVLTTTTKTKRFNRVSIQELTNIMSPETFILPSVSILIQYVNFESLG